MKKLTFILLLSLLLLINGCAVVAVGGAAALATNSAQDPRTLGRQLDDRTATLAIASNISEIEDYRSVANIDIEVFNGQLLLTGQAVNTDVVKEIVNIANSNDYITKLHNQIRVAPLATASTQAMDIIIANTIRAKFLAEESVDYSNVNVVVNAGEVFLMGIVSNVEATAAVEIARNVNNVTRVNRVFEIKQ